MNMNNLSKQEIEAVAINFLKGNITDHRGRKVSDYLNMSEHVMEMDHQWIQWAFPINSVSPHNNECGMIFEESKRFYRRGSKLSQTLNALLKKYLNSIGINYENAYLTTIDKNKFFDVIDGKHNHHVKRISRVLKHCRLTGNGYISVCIAHALMEMIKNHPDKFDSYTVALWFNISYTESWQWRN